MGPDAGEEQPEAAVTGWRGAHSRRMFLRRGALTGATVAFVGSFPGLSGLVTTAASDAPAAESDLAAFQSEAGSASLAQPLLAHVKDLGSGEISLFQGEREVILRDPALARRLFSAVRP